MLHYGYLSENGIPEDIVKKAEEKLNIEFPQSYRSFLLNFGAEEIYGVIKEDF